MIRKGIALIVMLLFVGMIISPSTGIIVKNNSIYTYSDGIILYVGGSGPGNYSNIKDAIDDARDGDTVFVYNDSSPYCENIIIDKSIRLVGEEKNTTVIDGKKEGQLLTQGPIR